MSYPDSCIKGIPNCDFVTQDGLPATHLFYFNIRKDGYVEQSINWNDVDEAITFTFSQTRNGQLQFRYGAAILLRSEIDRLISLPTVLSRLSYERQPLKDNPYHGNIMLLSPHTEPFMRMVAANLAMHVDHVVKRS